MEISNSSFYHRVTIGSYEKLKLIWTEWFASSEHNGPSSAKGGVIWCFCNQEGWSFLHSPCVSEGMTARGCKQPGSSTKLPPSHTRSNLEPPTGQTTASAWKQSRLHGPKIGGSLWPSAGFSLPVTWGRAPECPLLARPFPNRSPVNLLGVQIGCLCPGHGENKENTSSQSHRGCLMSLVGFGQCCSLPAAAFGSCTME